MGRALPVLTFELDDIQVATPCTMSWSAMVGGDKVRFCGACQKNVFNLSGMQRTEAMDLVRATEGRICVRFFRRDDGTILTEDCPVGLRKALKRARKLTLGAVATSLGAVAALLAVLGGNGAFSRKACTAVTSAQQTVQAVIDAPPSVLPTLGEPVARPHEIAGGLRAPPIREPREIKGKVARPIEMQGDIAFPPEAPRAKPSVR